MRGTGECRCDVGHASEKPAPSPAKVGVRRAGDERSPARQRRWCWCDRCVRGHAWRRRSLGRGSTFASEGSSGNGCGRESDHGRTRARRRRTRRRRTRQPRTWRRGTRRRGTRQRERRRPSAESEGGGSNCVDGVAGEACAIDADRCRKGRCQRAFALCVAFSSRSILLASGAVKTCWRGAQEGQFSRGMPKEGKGVASWPSK